MDPKIEAAGELKITRIYNIQKNKNNTFLVLKSLFLLKFLTIIIVCFMIFLPPKINKIQNVQKVALNQAALKSENNLIDLTPLQNLTFVGKNGLGTIEQNQEIINLLNHQQLNITFKVEHQNTTKIYQEVPKNLFNDDQVIVAIVALDDKILLGDYPENGFLFTVENLALAQDHTVETILYVAVSFVVVLIGLGTFFSVRKLRR